MLISVDDDKLARC